MAGDRIPPFKDRLRELRGKKSQAAFAEFIGTSRANIGFYENGDRVPDAVTLVKIAQKCNVSADWLLGITEIQSKRLDIKEVARATGLSERATETLLDAEYMRSEYKGSDIDSDREEMWRRYLQLVSSLLGNSSDLWKAVRLFSDYCDTVEAIGVNDDADIYGPDDFAGHLADLSLDSKKHEVVSCARLRDFRLYELMKKFEDVIKEKTKSVILQEKKNRFIEQLNSLDSKGDEAQWPP